MIIDPWGTNFLTYLHILILYEGTVLGEAEGGTGVTTAPIDMAFLESVRINMPVLDHRRAELYSVYDL